MELRDKLLSLRKEREITQEQLAEALFVSRQTIYKWETGRAQPDIDSLRSICELYRISADDLLEINTKPDSSASNALEYVPEAVEAAESESPLSGLWKKYSLYFCIIGGALVLLCAFLVIMLALPPKEIRQATELGIVPTEMTSGLSKSVTEKELLALLCNISEKESGEICKALSSAAANATKEQLTREKAAYWLYCTHIWTKLEPDADLTIGTHEPVDPVTQRNVYEELNSPSRVNVDNLESPWEPSLCLELSKANALFQTYDSNPEADKAINDILFGPYYTAVTFCLTQQSYANEKSILENSGDSFRPKEKLTRQEAITAVYRLYGSW